jgi:hypothetical protein
LVFISTDLSNIGRQFRISFFGGMERMRASERIMEYLDRVSEYVRIEERLVLEPPYFDEMAEVVNRIILNSPHAANILLHLDVVIMEYLFGGRQSIEKVLGTMYSIESLVLAKRIATMFCKYTGLKEELLEELWEL